MDGSYKIGTEGTCFERFMTHAHGHATIHYCDLRVNHSSPMCLCPCGFRWETQHRPLVEVDVEA